MPEQQQPNQNSHNKPLLPQHNTDDIIDIAGIEQTPTTFECEFCNVALLPYPALRIQNPYAGDGFICPQCGTITDSSYTGMRAQVRVMPVDVGDSTDVLETIPEIKGITLEHQVYDPEPQDDEQIRAMGGTITDKRITVKRDY